MGITLSTSGDFSETELANTIQELCSPFTSSSGSRLDDFANANFQVNGSTSQSASMLILSKEFAEFGNELIPWFMQYYGLSQVGSTVSLIGDSGFVDDNGLFFVAKLLLP